MKETRKVKVLHVVGAMNRAGTETMLMNIYRHIDHETFHFDFISYDQGAAHYDEEIESLNGRIIRLTKTSSIIQLYAAIKKHGPYDVVHAHTLFHSGVAMLAAFLAGVKIRISHAHTTLDQQNRFVRKLYIRMMRLVIIIFSTNLLACSREAGQYLFGEKNVAKRKYRYFPNVIDYANFLHVSEKGVKHFKQTEGIKDRGIVIGHIGTFKASKNHQFLLEITEALRGKNPAMNLLLVGDGELRKEVQMIAEQKGLSENIKFIGVTDNIPTILHSMDVFVFPSIYEGLGLVLLEAQASGLPCIVSEAIQPEADLGLDLLTCLSLADGPERWAEKIMQLADKKESNTDRIIDCFEKSGYSFINGIAMLQGLYNNHAGGAYE